jgi:hypothetical protein
MNPEDETFIRSVLGHDIRPNIITVDAHRWDGLSIMPFPHGTITGPDLIFLDRLRIETKKQIESNWQLFNARNIRLWTNSGIDTHAFPDMSVLDIVRYESVGCVSHLDENRHQSILEIIQEIYLTQPFEILFASEYEMEAVFLDRVSFEQAKCFQDLILTVAPEVFNNAIYQLYDTDTVDDEDAVARIIASQQRLCLYWA